MSTTGTSKYRSEYARSYEAHGKAEALVTILEARGLMPSERDRARILECMDQDQLDNWLEHAVFVAAADDLFR